MMVYGSQKGRGFNDIFGTLTSTFKPIAEGAANVGASLATGLVTDLLSGKNPKASIKERGNQAKGMVAQRALQSLQGGRGDVSPSSMGWSDKTAKRKRSRSKSQPPAKRKRESQTGGIYPPIHYPLGNYPGYDIAGNYPVMMGRGIISKMRNRRKKIVKIGTNDNKRDVERSVNPKNKRELGRNVNPKNKRELARNVNLENKLERKVNPENRQVMVYGQESKRYLNEGYNGTILEKSIHNCFNRGTRKRSPE